MGINQLTPIQSSLLKWFRQNRRDLPWRRTQDPYAVWISEIMLQQTQVNTVIPYFERWMKRFPTAEKLARASLSTVLKAWEGLGYYSRARNLHASAKIVVKKWRGNFPGSSEKLESLPGIGRYTAGAIASIAFNQPEPILDGNVKRVLARLFALEEPVDTSQGEKKLWEIAEQWVAGTGLRPEDNLYGDLNQSLMELGATVCLPENPQCLICPVRKICEAHQIKKEMYFPVKLYKQKLEKLRTVAAVVWKGNRVLLERQPLKRRWGGLWAFPHWIHRNGKGETEFLSKKMKKEWGMEIPEWRPRFEIRHGFTKYDVRLRIYEGTQKGPGPLKGRGPFRYTRWVEPQKVARLPLPCPHRKIAQLLQTPPHA